MGRRSGELEEIWLGSQKQARKRRCFEDGDYSCNWSSSSVFFDATSPPTRKQPARKSVQLGKEKMAKKFEIYSQLPKSSEELIAEVIEENSRLIWMQKNGRAESSKADGGNRNDIQFSLRENEPFEADRKESGSSVSDEPSLPTPVHNLSLLIELLLKQTQILSNKATGQFAKIGTALASVEGNCLQLRKDLLSFQQSDSNDDDEKSTA